MKGIVDPLKKVRDPWIDLVSLILTSVRGRFLWEAVSLFPWAV